MFEGLSPRALSWLRSIEVARKRAPFDGPAVRAALAGAEVDWPVLLGLEARFGGFGGQDFYLGLDGVPGDDLVPLVRTVLGRTHVWFGGSEWILWYVDEAGAIAEVDDHGHTFYVADSVARRLEQVAIWDVAASRHIDRLDGRHGERLAARLGLEHLPEPSDSRQRFWATPGFTAAMENAILVRESHEPIDYGVAERATFTWIGAGTDAHRDDVARAIALAP